MKILMIKRGAMGDILMTTPLIRQLKLNVKSCSIDFLTSQTFKAVLAKNPYINNILSIKDEWFNLKNCIHLFGAVLEFRGKYDYVFILDKHYYFSLLAFIIGGKTIGFGRDRISKVLLTNWASYDDLDRYQVLYYLDLLRVSRLLLPDYGDISLDITITDEAKVYVDDYLKCHEIKNFVVVVNSGGNNQFETSGVRMLPDDKILYLLTNLTRDCMVLLVGGNLDGEKYADYCKKLNCSQLINLAGKLNLEQSSYIMVNAKKIYTTDCGAMHLAISQGLDYKMVCFFGPTNPRHILPNDFKGKILWSDQDVYDPNYQLFGDLKKGKKFFSNLNLHELFENR